MGRKLDSEVRLVKEEFFKLMEDGEFRDLNLTKKGESLGVVAETIRRWSLEIPLEKWKEWREKGKLEVEKRGVNVDWALYKQALTGDVAAAKLWYQRHEGWSEKTEHTVRNGDLEKISDEELLRHFNKDVLEKAVKAKQIEVVGDVEPEVSIIKEEKNGEGGNGSNL